MISPLVSFPEISINLDTLVMHTAENLSTAEPYLLVSASLSPHTALGWVGEGRGRGSPRPLTPVRGRVRGSSSSRSGNRRTARKI